ncbi:KPN_02809 family neutral zinc metallopeptidase [Actibacterium lipolyticum]|uniref:Putative neutral zinc metallopeptidase n=1 Tax=Actibacterium lipolyticum TaxID=1524263 RepID=A0A238JYT0_9RHOB|nr:neutral zinc metallopeptidase [Actibacterium lipolyticum]SMX34992.1 Putative neutral zinc metallopeptidase [Actibacterium lipolyticum]
MKWQGRRGSRNIEDRRSRGGTGAGAVGGVGLLAVLAIGYFLGIDVSPLLEQGAVNQGGEVELTEADERAGKFVSVTLADTEEIWADLFRQQVGQAYNAPTLVLFKGSTSSPCGGASGATGPFYCPADKKAYLDTGFFTTMERQLGAKGDFAAAYVVAHEIAHHVQNELGVLGKANALRRQVSEKQSNEISVRIELQADCLSGIWAVHAQRQFGSLERGDLAEAMNAAKQIGDDTLQRNAGRVPMPHTFTHGTSEQRQRWFAKGYESGRIADCDTFGASRL